MRAIVVGTAGHIDHGKSALVEALTGVHPDRLKEERQRGITIDLGFAHLVEGDLDIALVDVPGHERFVRNMLAGAGGIDAVLLVVAADESVMPQTREHFEICRLLGIPHGVVAVTKSDLADADTRAVVHADVADLVAGTFLERAPVVDVSARTGAGLGDLRRELAGLADRPRAAVRSATLRLPVDRVFTMKGFGTVATGTLVSGSITDGESLVALPAGARVRVRGLQVHGRKVTDVDAPRRTAVNVDVGTATLLARGMTLARPGTIPVTRRADVLVSLLAGARPLTHGGAVRVHHGTADVAGRLMISATAEGTSGVWAAAAPGAEGVTVPAGGRAFGRLRLQVPMALTRGDRLVLRAPSPAATIGGALVLDPEPPAGRLRRAGAAARFEALLSDEPTVDLWITDSGARGLPVADLARRGGWDAPRVDALLAAATHAGRVATIGARVFASRELAEVERRALAALDEFHRARPTETGMPREDLRHRAAPGGAGELVDAVLADLVRRGHVAGRERVRLAAHAPATGETRPGVAEALLARLAAAGLEPGDPGQLAEAAGVSEAECRQVLQVLARTRAVIVLGGLSFHPVPLSQLRDEVRALGAGHAIDIAWFKARYGLTRKFAIPLLEWLDRERVTRRVGNARVVLAG